MYDQPTRTELLTAVADFLRHDAVPNLTGRVAFHGKVAANVVDIVRREVEQEASEDNQLKQQLEAFLDTRGEFSALTEQLCERIAAGEFTLATPGLMDYLWNATLHKLAVDQPGYSGYVHALERRSS